MEIEITEQKENALFNRKEIKAKIKSESTPSKDEVKKIIAEKLSSPEDGIRIMYIKGKFGVKEFEVSAHVYDSKEQRDATEKMSKKEQEAEAKAAPAPEAPAEQPAEAPKEETPAEPAVPAEKEIGHNPVEEAKEAEAEKAEEDKKEKEKTEEEKQAEK